MTALDAGLIALLIGLVEVVKQLVAWATKKPLDVTKPALSPKEHAWLRTLHELHDKFDTDGTPIWYVPRSWADTQNNIVKAQRDIAENVRRSIECLERIEKRLETK